MLDIEILCNTPDQALFSNIAANSRAHHHWVKTLPAHDGHAVIVGGGPSLADTLPLVRKRFGLGQKVFALNGAAGFLNLNGIIPDYQVMCDARPENVDLIADANAYLIASQCDPLVFHGLHNVTIWHPAIDEVDLHLPEHPDSYSLVGGGTTVGLSAMCLAYVLGYRKIHLFGYDCSHRDDDGHAYAQAMNAREPLVKVTVEGRSYTASLAMAKQAELFPQVCANLQNLGCTITVDGDGLIREVVNQMAVAPEVLPEAEKYRRMWAFPQYRDFSPGEQAAAEFVALGVDKDTHVIDFGCGSGKGALAIYGMTDCQVTLVDFAANAVDAGNDLPFIERDLTKPMGLTGDVGFCTDVMEHIPPEDVPAVIANIMACVPRCFFKIALFPDNMGALIGQPLHLSVFPPEWWAEQFAAYDVLVSRTDADTAHPYATFYVQTPKEA